MSRRFTKLCQATERTTPPFESIEKPSNDFVQDAWEHGIRRLKRDGKAAPNAQTAQQLIDGYGEHGGLLFIEHEHIEINHANTRKNREQIVPTLALTDDVPVADHRAAAEFERVETVCDLYADPRMVALSPRQRVAVDRFVRLWLKQERGEKITRSESTHLSKLRKESGLALRLTEGRRVR